MIEPERVWVIDRSWRLTQVGDPRKCRASARKPCLNPVAAELNRGKLLRSGGEAPSWWAYCADHLYGNRINGDHIESSVAADSPAAERGYMR